MRHKKFVVLLLCMIMMVVITACGKPAEEIGEAQPGQEDTMREEAPDTTEPTAEPVPTAEPDVTEPIAEPAPTEAPNVTEPTAEPVPTEAPEVTEPTAEPVPTEAPEQEEPTIEQPGETVEIVSRNETSASAFQYTIQDGKVTIDYLIDPSLKEVCIPEKIEGCPVTAIGYNAFASGSEMESLDIPGTVENVAFSMVFSPLKKLTLQEGVKTIGYRSFFENQMLEEVHIPDSVIAIYDGALPTTPWIEKQMGDNDFLIVGDGILYAVNSNVSGDIVIPEGVKSIANGVFNSCNVENVQFPKSLVDVNIQTFLYTPWYDNLISTAEIEELIINDNMLLWVSPNVKGDYVVPEGVTTVCMNAFYGCWDITSVTFPEGVISINEPFWACFALTNIKLPSSVASIQMVLEYVFMDIPFPQITVPAGSYAEQWANDSGYSSVLIVE